MKSTVTFIIILLFVNIIYAESLDFFLEEINCGLFVSSKLPNMFSDPYNLEIKRKDVSIEYYTQSNNVPLVKGINFGLSYQIKNKDESGFSEPILTTRITYPKMISGVKTIEWRNMKSSNWRINVGIPITDEKITPVGEYVIEILFKNQSLIVKKFSVSKFDWNINYVNSNVLEYKSIGENPNFSKIEKNEWKTSQSLLNISRIDNSYNKVKLTDFEKFIHILNASDETFRTSFRIENSFIRYFSLYNGKDSDFDSVFDTGIYIEYIFENDGYSRTDVYYKALPVAKITANKFSSIYFENSENTELLIDNTLK